MKNTKYLILILISSLSNAVQTCQTESDINSTTPDSQFVDNGDGTITDKSTQLMWQKCQLGYSGIDCATGSTVEYNWGNALTEAQNNTFATFTDWRIPNIKELKSIVELRCFSPAINTNFFQLPDGFNVEFWSSTPKVFNTDRTWYVNFFDGDSDYSSRTNTRRVRLVRSEYLLNNNL